MMTKEQHIEALAETVHTNYDCSKYFAKDLAEFLYDEGYRLECQSTWVYDEYSEDTVCCACNGKAPEVLSNYCPHCGAKMKGEQT